MERKYTLFNFLGLFYGILVSEFCLFVSAWQLPSRYVLKKYNVF